MTGTRSSERSPAEPGGGAALAWMLLFAAGLVVPALALGLAYDAPPAGRLAAALLPLAVLDAPLVVAGARGRGPVGIVQPWRWDQYAFWLGVRLVLLVPLAFLPAP